MFFRLCINKKKKQFGNVDLIKELKDINITNTKIL